MLDWQLLAGTEHGICLNQAPAFKEHSGQSARRRQKAGGGQNYPCACPNYLCFLNLCSHNQASPESTHIEDIHASRMVRHSANVTDDTDSDDVLDTDFTDTPHGASSAWV